jgi:hypothetical protein
VFEGVLGVFEVELADFAGSAGSSVLSDAVSMSVREF